MRYQHSEFAHLGTLGFPFCYKAQIMGWLSFPALGIRKGLCKIWELQRDRGNGKGKFFQGDTGTCSETPFIVKVVLLQF